MLNLQSTASRWSPDLDVYAASRPLELSVVIPTLNERENVRQIVERLDRVLKDVVWEVTFVDDDSVDGTAEAVKAIGRRDRRVQCLHRVGRRGLAGAVVEGAMASAATYVAVMDGDLQHDERLLPRMLDLLRADRADLVVGSRYLNSRSSPDEGLSPFRQVCSRLARRLAALVIGDDITDPVSGFFMTRRALIGGAAKDLSTDGFKILFDLIACHASKIDVVELPYHFAPRRAGASKFDGRAVADYLGLLASRGSGLGFRPQTIVGVSIAVVGVLINLLTLLSDGGADPMRAQVLGALLALTTVFFAAEAFAARRPARRGLELVACSAAFIGLSGLGLVSNLAVFTVVAAAHSVLMGGVIAAAVGAVWNHLAWTTVEAWS